MAEETKSQNPKMRFRPNMSRHGGANSSFVEAVKTCAASHVSTSPLFDSGPSMLFLRMHD